MLFEFQNEKQKGLKIQNNKAKKFYDGGGGIAKKRVKCGYAIV